MLRRTTALFLLVVMFMLVACVPPRVDGGNDDGNGDNPLEYTTFRWGLVEGNLYIPTAGQTSIGDAILQRYADMEETYNLEIITELQPLKEGDLTTRLAVQQNVYDFYQSAPRYEGLDKYNMGVLYALEDIDTIDSESEKWGYKNFISAAKFSDGKQYGFFPNEWSYSPNIEGILQFNVDLINEIGITNPYEYYEQRIWNWDTFTNVLQTIKDSGIIEDIKPWTAVSFNEDSVSIMFVNGLKGLDRDVNGNYTFGFDCDAGLAALEYLYNLRLKELYHPNSNGEFATLKTAVFHSSSSGGATSAPSVIGAESIATMVDNYGVITFPYGPNGSWSDVSTSVNHSSLYQFIINQSDNTAEDIGIFMEAIFEPLDGVPSWKEYLVEDIFQDLEGRDYDNFIYMLEHCNDDYSTYYGDTSVNFIDGYFAKAVRGEVGIAEAFASIRDAVQTELNKKTQNIAYDILED